MFLQHSGRPAMRPLTEAASSVPPNSKALLNYKKIEEVSLLASVPHHFRLDKKLKDRAVDFDRHHAAAGFGRARAARRARGSIRDRRRDVDFRGHGLQLRFFL
jgi:hypothetical protein